MLDQLVEKAPGLGAWFSWVLPVSAEAAARWQLDDLVAATTRRAWSLRVAAARVERAGGPAVPGSELVSAAVLHGVLGYVLADATARHPGPIADAVAAADAAFPALDAFAAHYPPASTPQAGRAATELWLLSLAMENPALEPMRPLFDDAALRDAAPAAECVGVIEATLAEAPVVQGLPLPDLLRAPMRASPTDLAGQLTYALEAWAALLPEALRQLLLRAVDLVAEARAARFAGPGPVEVPVFDPAQALGPGDLGERFTPDRDWMANVVLIAKQTYVWLDQLSKAYGRPIRTLDAIPDAELDRLARYGFTGLWLIGLWERSHASRAIKQRMGNPEALASAYSLYDTVIAHDLGGEAAWQNLRGRAAARGIKLAADMVPNHVGIDGRWVVEHPDWFLQLRHPPYPGYSFNGPDLCEDGRVGVYLEDGYWNRSDAAVVFKRVDHHTGDVRYIYHGNDGTQMPWNDTAQLDYLNPEAREAVIQTILWVARHFPIIRFDAAMTLARQHIQRLWYPPPGHGGAVPSRAEHGSLTREAFDAAIPHEFWREVVDRVQAEVPDTLLLAEAFWMMEGYFVRSLGMHRVYNSAFMNMLKMEENAKYRSTVRNVLAYSPEILKRFVNFMNNPDEDTAEAQFGTGDKYIGVALLMVTMPGLPMFGHGQIEGFTEKYGMEYPRAYRDETPDAHLVARHERAIFPLMRARHLFSEVDHFAFYDFVTPEGHVDENVFAYSNRCGDERAVVLYNNVYGSTRGRAMRSVGLNVGPSDAPELAHPTLADALGLQRDRLYAFRDHQDDHWYLRWGGQVADHGLYAELGGYQWHVFVDWRDVGDDPLWAKIAHDLGGASVDDLDAAYGVEKRRPDCDRLFPVTDALLSGEGVEAALAAWLDDDDLAAEVAADIAAARALELPEVHGFAAFLRAAPEDFDLAVLADTFVVQGNAPADARVEAAAARLLADHPDALLEEDLAEAWEAVLETSAARDALRANTHQGVTYVHKESADALLQALVAEATRAKPKAAAQAEAAAEALGVALEAAGFRLAAWVEALDG
jgi:glycosidase